MERFEMNGERGNHVSGSFPHGLTGLKHLVLDGMDALDDYSALNECAEMTYLSLTMGMKYETGMSAEYADSLFDYSYLRNMPELKSLTVMAASDNAIKYISSVEGLESLIIYLGYPYGGGLEAMSDEEMLRIADSYDLSPLGTLSHLRSFKVIVTSFPSYLNDTDLLEKIAHKINRNILTAAPEGITSLDLMLSLDEENTELLGRFKKLESFNGSLESSQGILSFLSETKEMKELRLYFGDYIGSSVDLSYVGDLPSLKLLSIETYDDIPFTGTDKLSRSGGPEELYLDCTLSSISPDGSLSFLNGMDRLRKLKIHRINNNKTSSIASLSNLEDLDIGISFGRPEGEYYDESEPKTEVNVDLSFMARLDQLREIDLSVSADEGYVVSPLDLSPLNGKQKLRKLSIDAYSAVPDLSTLTACDELKQIEIWPGESNKYVCMQQARRFAAGNQYFAISERYGGIYLDRVYSPVSAYTAEDSSVSAENETSETTYPIGTAAVPSLEAVYTGSNNSIAPSSVLGGLSLGQLVAAWGEPDGGYDRTMTQTFRVAWWYIDGTDHMLSVKCIGTGSEVFDARIDPLTDPAYPLIDIDSVPDVYHPSDETILTLRQALECVNYAHTMIYRMSLDFPEDEIDDRLAGSPYCWTFVGYDTGFCPYFGSGAPCDEWISDHSHSLVFHSNKDQFPGELMLPVWKIKVHTIDGDGLSYDEIIYVEARRGNMYNATNDGGYMPSPYKDRSLYAQMYFTA